MLNTTFFALPWLLLSSVLSEQIFQVSWPFATTFLSHYLVAVYLVGFLVWQPKASFVENLPLFPPFLRAPHMLTWKICVAYACAFGSIGYFFVQIWAAGPSVTHFFRFLWWAWIAVVCASQHWVVHAVSLLYSQFVAGQMKHRQCREVRVLHSADSVARSLAIDMGQLLRGWKEFEKVVVESLDQYDPACMLDGAVALLFVLGDDVVLSSPLALPAAAAAAAAASTTTTNTTTSMSTATSSVSPTEPVATCAPASGPAAMPAMSSVPGMVVPGCAVRMVTWLAEEAAIRTQASRTLGLLQNLPYIREGQRRSAFFRVKYAIYEFRHDPAGVGARINSYLSDFGAFRVQPQPVAQWTAWVEACVGAIFKPAGDVPPEPLLSYSIFWMWLNSCQPCGDHLSIEAFRQRASDVNVGWLAERRWLMNFSDPTARLHWSRLLTSHGIAELARDWLRDTVASPLTKIQRGPWLYSAVATVLLLLTDNLWGWGLVDLRVLASVCYVALCASRVCLTSDTSSGGGAYGKALPAATTARVPPPASAATVPPRPPLAPSPPTNYPLGVALPPAPTAAVGVAPSCSVGDGGGGAAVVVPTAAASPTASMTPNDTHPVTHPVAAATPLPPAALPTVPPPPPPPPAAVAAAVATNTDQHKGVIPGSVPHPYAPPGALNAAQVRFVPLLNRPAKETPVTGDASDLIVNPSFRFFASDADKVAVFCEPGREYGHEILRHFFGLPTATVVNPAAPFLEAYVAEPGSSVERALAALSAMPDAPSKLPELSEDWLRYELMRARILVTPTELDSEVAHWRSVVAACKPLWRRTGVAKLPHLFSPSFTTFIKRYYRDMFMRMGGQAAADPLLMQKFNWNDEPLARYLNIKLTPLITEIVEVPLTSLNTPLSVWIMRGEGFPLHRDSSPPFDITLDLVVDHRGDPRPISIMTRNDSGHPHAPAKATIYSLEVGESALFMGSQLPHIGWDLPYTGPPCGAKRHIDDLYERDHELPLNYHAIMIFTWQMVLD